MTIMTLLLTALLLTALGWALTRWVRADPFHPRPQRPEWFD